MSKSLKKSAIKVSNIGEYVSNSRAIQSLTYRITPKGEECYVRGLRHIIPANQVKQSYPTDLIPHQKKGANPHRSKNWTYGGKAY